jgi:hypothetical protein
MRSERAAAAVAAVALVAAAACAAAAWRSADGPRRLVPVAAAQAAPSEAAPGRSAASEPPTTAPLTTPADAPPSRVAPPVSVQVPAVGLTARVVPVGLTPAGAITVPDPSVAGWYDLGPAPGALGPAVVVGHVDTRSGAAVFYALNRVRAGQTVTVFRSDGTKGIFVVRQVTEVHKTQFPTAQVFAPTSDAELRLVTCTGQFDISTGHYIDSLIIWAAAVR